MRRQVRPRATPMQAYALLLAAAVLASLAFVTRANVVYAQEPPCQALINGEDVRNYGSYGDAIELPYGDTVTLALGSTSGLGNIRVNITAGPFGSEIDPLSAQTARNGAIWEGEVSLEDYARYGVGLYQVTLTSDSGCDLTLWVNVTGKSAVASVAGAAAVAVLVVGVLMQLTGFIIAFRRPGGRWLAILGGIPTGIGLTVLSQQAGLTPIAWEWAAIWTIPPMAIGAVIHGGLSTRLGGRGSAGEGYEPDLAPFPQEKEYETAPPPPPPPSAAEPPLPPPSAPPIEAPTGADPPPGQPDEVLAPTGSDRPRTANGGSGAGAGTGSGARRSAGGATSAEDLPRDPPRSSYALLDCPNAVTAQEEFELKFGLSPVEVAGVAGPALVRPASSIGSYFLTVQIVAEGFDIRPGEHWRHELPVTADSPYPVAAIHLTPRPQTDAVRASAIQAFYSVSGQSMGFAVRPVAILANSGVAAPHEPPELDGAVVSVPTDEPAADLTVRIQKGDSTGDLLWTFDTPYPLVRVPDERVLTNIGDDPRSFARAVVDQMGSREGQIGVYVSLTGFGKKIADQMPEEFWDLLEEVAANTAPLGRPPSVFFLTEDPYMPWELALMRTRLDPDLPEFLGAQAAVGRWALGKQRPKLPPPQRAEVDSMAVIWGEYNQPGWNRLLEAEAEAADLGANYAAVNVNAARLDVLRCLNGTPEADVLHFAVHGIYDPNSVANGIVLVDGNYLNEVEVSGSRLEHAPFVFLNACQVGSGQAILGDHGGMAHAFLYAGAGGVVAPLWSIKDSIARDIATRFYVQAFEGVPPAEILRRERATFEENLDTTSATCMAYVWYGHPSFTLKRLQGDGQ